MLTYDLIDCKSWEYKLQAEFTSVTQAIPSKTMLTPVAAAKAYFHDPVDSLDLAHSLDSGIIGCDGML